MTNPAVPSYPAAAKYRGIEAAHYVQRRASEPTWAWEDESVRQYVASLGGGLQVLDVPVGSGRYVPIFLDAGWTVHGCDISAEMISVAKEHLGERFSECEMVVAPAEAMPWADDSIDVIVSGRFIQWIPELSAVDRVIAEFARVGRGELFIQLRIPARPRTDPTLRGAFRQAAQVVSRKVRRRRLARSAGSAAQISTHSEPDLLAILDRHGWRVTSIGVECPSDPGLRFYRCER